MNQTRLFFMYKNRNKKSRKRVFVNNRIMFMKL